MDEVVRWSRCERMVMGAGAGRSSLGPSFCVSVLSENKTFNNLPLPIGTPSREFYGSRNQLPYDRVVVVSRADTTSQFPAGRHL